MKAIVLREIGSIDNLRLEEMPDPTPGPGEVVVRLRAAALNHRDVWVCKGKYPGINFPAVLGSDGAGQIAAIGPGVDGLREGQDVVINPSLDWGPDPRVQGPKFRILGMPDFGTFAELVKVPAINVATKPAGMSFEQAAAIPLAGLTAYRAVVTKAEVRAGETVLVTGIGAGTATFALQFAKGLGARVFVTSGSIEKLERARALGADGGVNYRDPDWSSKLRELGVPDAAIDSAGGETFAACLDLLRPGGRLVTFGSTTGPVPHLDVFRLFWKQLRLIGTTMGTPAEFSAMLERFDDPDPPRPVVDRSFPLEQAVDAMRHMEEAGQFGKIVLKID